MWILFIFLAQLIMSINTENIPMAVEIPAGYNQVLRKIEQLNFKIDVLNLPFHNENFGRLIREFNDNLGKFKKYSKNTESLTQSVDNFNKLLEPISKIANNELISTEIEANTKEKERIYREKIEMAKLRADFEKISTYEAIKLIEHEKTAQYKYIGYVAMFVAGVCIGGAGIGKFGNGAFGNSKL